MQVRVLPGPFVWACSSMVRASVNSVFRTFADGRARWPVASDRRPVRPSIRSLHIVRRAHRLSRPNLRSLHTGNLANTQELGSNPDRPPILWGRDEQLFELTRQPLCPARTGDEAQPLMQTDGTDFTDRSVPSVCIRGCSHIEKPQTSGYLAGQHPLRCSAAPLPTGPTHSPET